MAVLWSANALDSVTKAHKPFHKPSCVQCFGDRTKMDGTTVFREYLKNKQTIKKAKLEPIIFIVIGMLKVRWEDGADVGLADEAPRPFKEVSSLLGNVPKRTHALWWRRTQMVGELQPINLQLPHLNTSEDGGDVDRSCMERTSFFQKWILSLKYRTTSRDSLDVINCKI